MSDALDQIAKEASIGEAEAQAEQDAINNPEAEEQIDPAQVWAQIPKMFGGLLAMAMPELKAAYNDQACLQWGGAMAAVADKYGWDAAETFSRFGPEIALCCATIPLALPTIAAIRERSKKERAKRPVDVQVNPVEQEPEAGGNFSEPQ